VTYKVKVINILVQHIHIFCFHNSWTHFSVNILCGHICSPTSTLYSLPVFNQFCFSNYIVFGVRYVHPSPHIHLFHVIMVEATINISHTCWCWKSIRHIHNLGHATSHTEHNLKPHCLWLSLALGFTSVVVSAFTLPRTSHLKNKINLQCT